MIIIFNKLLYIIYAFRKESSLLMKDIHPISSILSINYTFILKIGTNTFPPFLFRLGLFKNSPALTKPPETAPIRLLKAPLKVPGMMVSRLFSLPKSAGAMVGSNIYKPKRNRTELIYIYIYIFNL